MNKQELIKHFEEMEYVSIHQMGKKAFIDMIEQLDEPQKVAIPQFVADWIEYAKFEDYHLLGAMDAIATSGRKNLYDWLWDYDDNMDIFARAWLDGYEVEKKKRYFVEIKGAQSSNYLNRETINGTWYMGNIVDLEPFTSRHTRKELEEAGFGWVFDCPGMEVEEVQE